MTGRSVPSWQVVLSDLALILFLTTLAAMQGTQQEVAAKPLESPRAHELAVYREGAGGLSLGAWLDLQSPDPRAQLTILARYAPEEFAAVEKRARALAQAARDHDKAPRVVLEPATASEITVSLAYDSTAFQSQAQATRLRPADLAR